MLTRSDREVVGGIQAAFSELLLLEFFHPCRIPELEVLADSREEDIALQSGRRPQFRRDEDPARVVEIQVDCAADQDPLKHATRVGKSGEFGALLLPARPRVQEKAAVRVTGERDAPVALRDQGVAMAGRNRNPPLRIQRQFRQPLVPAPAPPRL